MPALPPAEGLALAWWRLLASTLTPSDTTILPPGPRNRTHDFVVKGFRIEQPHIRLAWKLHDDFLRAADGAVTNVSGSDPGSLVGGGAAAAALGFNGTGIAILGGAPPYLTPMLVTLKALRRTGCTLPVEVWFPEAEAPTAALAASLELLGARLCVFPFPAFLGKVRF